MGKMEIGRTIQISAPVFDDMRSLSLQLLNGGLEHGHFSHIFICLDEWQQSLTSANALSGAYDTWESTAWASARVTVYCGVDLSCSQSINAPHFRAILLYVTQESSIDTQRLLML